MTLAGEVNKKMVKEDYQGLGDTDGPVDSQEKSPEPPEEWRYIFAADCAPKRFDVPYNDGWFFEIRAMTAAQDEALASVGWDVRFRSGRRKGEPDENVTRIDTLKTYLMVCKFTVADFFVKRADGTEKRWSENHKDNEGVYRELAPKVKDWLKERIAEVNPSVSWAERPFESGSTDGSGDA